MKHAQSLIYRKEIDGLRAMAVSAVVLYHFGFPALGGGFVGVDVFFVISGFLIGGLLWSELQHSGTIDLRHFFLRRIRRLAPAYFFVAIISTLAAYFVLLPFEFREFGKTLIAATAWLSNIQFFREAGYFDVASDNKVLLHTWSLAVEEQFYFALPLVLLLLWSTFERWRITLLAIMWAASLASCLLVTPVSPTATFFLFPFRAWELLSGVLLAVWGYELGARWRYGPMLSWLGILLVVGAMISIRSGPQFPGWQATVPVLGSVLLLLNGQDDNLVNRLLSARIPAFIGLISYSLYLWHWPVFTLSTYWLGDYEGPFEGALWMLLALVLAVIAWALVERPCRRLLSDRILTIGFIALFVFTLSAGASIYLSNGSPSRFSDPARTHVDASTSFFSDYSRCAIETVGPLKGLNVCFAGPAGTPEVLFWGDSHLRAHMGGIQRAAAELKTPALMIWQAGCPPLFGMAKQENSATAAQDAQCLADTQQLRNALSELPQLKRVALIGRWSYYATGTGVGVDAHNTISLSASPYDGLEGETQQALYESSWNLTIKELTGQVEQVFVLRQVPEMPRYVARDLAKRLVYGRMSADEVDVATHVEAGEIRVRTTAAEEPLRQMELTGSIHLLDPWSILCDPRCSVVHNGRSYYFDNNHLSNEGADALRTLWGRVLTGKMKP